MKMIKRIMAGALAFALCVAVADTAFARCGRGLGAGQQGQRNAACQFLDEDVFSEGYQRSCQAFNEEGSFIPRGLGRGFGRGQRIRQGLDNQSIRQGFNNGINECEWCPWLELQ
ncbi:MAG: hypothetical protein FWC76_00765 [Defluviitaleaceae bacterium]|nr:hypothetical protein [Defluviitaleaceae bacterium]